MIHINEEDIDFAEKLLLPHEKIFDDERRNIIRCLEEKDIRACPGSGKTTTLLAKLLILEKKLPLEKNRGICVLTHTNVAIDEISNRLGRERRRIFTYPNNFSTIQSFVNEYLAIPAYNHFFKKDINCIDNDTYREAFFKTYRNVFRPGSDSYLINQGLLPEVLCDNLKYDLHNRNIILKDKQPFAFGSQTRTYRNLYQVKQLILESGILSFHDAYVLAFEYLRENEEIKEMISSRFAFLFIDEMQDTDSKQNELIEKIFDPCKVIIQRIGDENQSIYESGEEITWTPKEGFLSITDSQRFSSVIAARVNKICVNPQELAGNPNIPNIPPILLRFNAQSIKKVLPAFALQIYENGLHNLPRKVFKAVGRVGSKRDDSKLTIGSFYNHYVKDSPKRLKNYQTFKGYLSALTWTDSLSVNDYRQLFINCILKSLRTMNVKKNDRWFTEKSLFKFLKENDQNLYNSLNRNLTIWISNRINNIGYFDRLRNFIINELSPFFGVNRHSIEMERFLNRDEGFSTLGNSLSPINLFSFKKDEQEIQIELDTIHSVKGETHTATLYLETYNYHYDFEKIMEYLKGNHSPTSAKRTISNLRLAYVGMTRPSHLLCVAIRNESINGHEEDLIGAGWRVLDVDECITLDSKGLISLSNS